MDEVGLTALAHLPGVGLLGEFIRFFHQKIAVAGVLLLLLPSGSSQKNAESDSSGLLAQVLSCSEGVGNARVLISDSGVVVVCEGAANPKVRLDIICAVESYTGDSSDKITILRMTDKA